jgi:hypothetical protein
MGQLPAATQAGTRASPDPGPEVALSRVRADRRLSAGGCQRPAAGIRGISTREIAVATGVPTRTVRDVRCRYRAQAPALATRLLALSVIGPEAVTWMVEDRRI